MSNRPWMKFFPANWRADPTLRMCSIGARGLWMEMLCIMHEASPRGRLLVNGQSVATRQIAALAGVSLAQVAPLLDELEQAGVFSRDQDGVIYSRRMVREARISDEARANGRKGGNPALKAGDKEGVNPRANPYMASGISPSETHPSEDEDVVPRAGDGSEPSWRIEFSMQFWPAYPHQTGRPKALAAYIRARQRFDQSRIMDGLARYIREKPPDRPWLNPANFLDEERFDDRPAATAPRRPERAHDAIFGALAEIAAEGPRVDQRPPGPDGGVFGQPGPASGDTPGDRPPNVVALSGSRRPS